MITEDYVSFEVAKLLKEKGFESDDCHTAYDSEGKFFWHGDYSKERSGIMDAPTLQMAMKWLREVHDKQCNIELNFYSKWHFLVVDTKVTEIDHYEQMKSYPTDNSDGFSSYEEAAEAAIKYCLNLI